MIKLARRHARQAVAHERALREEAAAVPEGLEAAISQSPSTAADRRAPEEIDEDLAEMEIEIPRDMVGRVIGSRGSVINAIREESGADVRLDKHEDGAATLTVQGSERLLKQVGSLLKMALEGELPQQEGGERYVDDARAEAPRRTPDGRSEPAGLPPSPAAQLQRRLEVEALLIASDCFF